MAFRKEGLALPTHVSGFVLPQWHGSPTSGTDDFWDRLLVLQVDCNLVSHPDGFGFVTKRAPEKIVSVSIEDVFARPSGTCNGCVDDAGLGFVNRPLCIITRQARAQIQPSSSDRSLPLTLPTAGTAPRGHHLEGGGKLLGAMATNYELGQALKTGQSEDR